MKLKVLLYCYIVILLIVSSRLVYSISPECDQPASSIPREKWDVCREEYEKEATLLEAANATNKEELARSEKQLSSLSQKIKALGGQVKILEQDIQAREVDLGFQKELLAARVRNFYIRSHHYSPLLLLLSSDTATTLTRELAFRQSVTNQDKALIVSLAGRIARLKTDKETVSKNKAALASLQKQVDQKVKFLQGEVAKTESYLASLSAKQQEILALKAGGFATSVGDVPLADDPASRPDYDPGFSPAFAAFSFGAPHRKGLSQYGAFGRAKAGQSAEQILKAYYGDGIEIKKDYSTGINIRVQGHGTVDIETYVKRIYEMPSSWGNEGGMEALKAQAVAARSYALAYTNNGSGSICATESCQVYKPANKGGKWEEAVNATRGWVLMAGGRPFSAWYASTAGGYTFSYGYSGYSTPGLWDTPRGREGWTSEAWEKSAGSPWFYKAWYRLRSGNSCGRSHPWLTQEEFSDILNALLVYKGDSGSVIRLTSLDSKSCLGKEIADTWDRNRVKEESAKHGGPITRVDSVSVIYSNEGFTQRVIVSTDKGVKEFSGEDFKYIFNLRVPGAIGIKSSLFNLMKK